MTDLTISYQFQAYLEQFKRFCMKLCIKSTQRQILEALKTRRKTLRKRYNELLRQKLILRLHICKLFPNKILVNKSQSFGLQPKLCVPTSKNLKSIFSFNYRFGYKKASKIQKFGNFFFPPPKRNRYIYYQTFFEKCQTMSF